MSINSKKMIALAVLILFVAVPGRSFSMDFSHVEDASKMVPQNHKSGERSNVSSDQCLSLLKTASYEHKQSSSMYSGNRSAARASALGVIFGVRFALGPKEVLRNKKSRMEPKMEVWQLEQNNSTGNEYKALAVADYRRCKKEEALSSLSDWRWQR